MLTRETTFMYHAIRREVRELPSLLRIGALVFGIGSLIDLLYHGAPATWTPYLGRYLGPDGHRGHLVIMAGMALIVLGLVVDGILCAGRRAAKVARGDAAGRW